MIELHPRQLVAALVCAAAIAMPGAHGAKAADASLIEQAKKEGKLVIYTGVERAAAQAMVEAFHKKYPFIDAQQVRASSSKLATRLDAEIEANRVGGDLFEYLAALPHHRPEASQRDPAIRFARIRRLSEDLFRFRLLGGHGLKQHHHPAQHPPRSDADNMPKSWWDLTKPYWRNKLTIDNLEVSGTGYHWLVAIVNDERLGWKYIEALGKNKPALERGHAGMAQKVAAGEYFGAIEMADFHLKEHCATPSSTVPVRWCMAERRRIERAMDRRHPQARGTSKRGEALPRLPVVAGGPDDLCPRRWAGPRHARMSRATRLQGDAALRSRQSDAGISPEESLKVRD